jgi:UDP-N-acetylmuramate--alanine ligase
VPDAPFDLAAPRRIHIVAIGGAGMSGIAAVLARLGHTVSGSDLKESRGLDRLRLLGVTVSVGHRADQVPDGLDALVASTAVPPTNPEVVVARDRGVPILRRAEMLRLVVATRRSIAVGGTHGKTTTSSMLTLILRAAGWRPTFLIGGDVNEVGTNAAYDTGEWLVVEADESDGTFLELAPTAVLVTNVEPDHLEHHGTFAALVDGFRRFLAGAPGPRVACIDDPFAGRLAATVGDVVTFGTDPGADYRIADYAGGRASSTFRLVRGGDDLGAVELPSPGLYNARNAAGAAAMACELGVPFTAVRDALGRFGGVARRFTFRGEVDGVTLVDDYAHLPGEVRAVLATAREGGWRRVIAVFQPHRYSRIAHIGPDFADAFVDADVVVLTDIDSAGEAPRPGVSGAIVRDAVLEAHPATRLLYLPRRSDVLGPVRGLTRPGDLVLTLGAGDITLLADEWLLTS